MGRPDRDRNVRLLLLARSAGWCSAAAAAAQRIGTPPVEAASNARDAIMRLARAPVGHTCLLVEPAAADGLLDHLLAMTAGAADESSVVLLGGGPEHPDLPRATTPQPAAVIAAIGRAADANGSAGGHRPPRLNQSSVPDSIQARYQPIVRMADREPVGVEVLARLHAPGQPPMAADRFVPALEQAGRATELTEAIVARAAQEPVLADANLDVSLNLPLDVLLVAPVVDRLRQTCEMAGLAASRCILELTESRPVDDLPALGRAVERLRGLGYRVAIDDVGPGVAHHHTLFDLPFSALKLAMEIVRLSIDSPAAADFVARTIAMAQHRRLTVVAEGVEDEAIWARMQALGADLAQGFLIARPLPAAVVPIWMQGWRDQPASHTAR